MTERATSEQPQQAERETYEEEVAAAIAAMFLAAGAPVPGAVAALLLRLVPSYVPEDLRERVAFDAASFVPDRLPRPTGGTATRDAYVDNLLRRAHYAINVVKRLSAAVRAPVRDEEGPGPGLEQRLRTALEAEERFFGQHREAAKRRVAGAKLVDAASELYGEVLGWKHGHPKEPRPHHKAADGRNFRVGTVPASTGALPGVLPGCTCSVVAPHENGEMLT